MAKNGTKTTNEANTPISTESMTPGQQLRRAREAKNLTQDAVAKQLFINKQTIIDIEEDNYSKLVAQVYTRGYVLSYARLLQIPPKELLDEFAKLTDHAKNNQPPMNILQGIPTTTTTDHQRHWLSYVAVIIIFIALALWGYSHYEQNTTNKVLEKSTPAVTAIPDTNVPPATDTDTDNKTTTIINIPKQSVTNGEHDTNDTQNTQDTKDSQ